MKALVLGGSGEVGQLLVKRLLESKYYSKITTISRKPLVINTDNNSEKKLTQLVSPHKDLYSFLPFIKLDEQNYDAAFTCLGIRYPHRLSEKEVFHAEVELNSSFVHLAKRLNVKHFAYNSYIHTSIHSSNQIMRMKGLLEQILKQADFKSCSSFRACWIKRKPMDRDKFPSIVEYYYYYLFDYLVRENFRFVGPFMYIPVILLPNRMKSIDADDLAKAIVVDSIQNLEFSPQPTLNSRRMLGRSGWKRMYYEDILHYSKRFNPN